MTKAEKKQVRSAILALQRLFLGDPDAGNPGENEDLQLELEQEPPPRSGTRRKQEGVYPKAKLVSLGEKAIWARVPSTEKDVSVPLSMLTDECRETLPRPGGTFTLAIKPGAHAIQRIEDMLP